MKRTTRRATLLAFVAAFVMSLAFAGAAFAAGTGSITLNGNTAGHTYEAYQIFKGDYDQKQGQAATLSNVEWGANVKYDASDFYANLNVALGTSGVSDAKGAAEALAAGGETAAANFADFVSGYLTGTPIPFANQGDKPYAGGLEQGYYLVKDVDGTVPKLDTATKFMMRVVGDDTASVKSATTESHKWLQEDSVAATQKDAWQKVADAETGQDVEFMLTSTIPTNVESYKDYWVVFKDTLSKGLTFKGVKVNDTYDDTKVDVFLVNAFQAQDEITLPLQNKIGTFDLSSSTTDAEGAKSFDIRFDSNNFNWSGTAGKVIVVRYTATVNDKAIVGKEGNPNDFYTEYNRNPNVKGDGDKGTTPDEKVVVFTYELDIDKYNKASDKLAGAEFKLFRETVNGKEFAIIEKGKIQGWTADESAVEAIKTDVGGSYQISGLDSGDKYYLLETKAPDGYNKLEDPIELVISSKIDKVEGYGNGYKITELKLNGVDTSISPDQGIVTQGVLNNEGAGLPSTGGMGTIIFTVVGIAVMVVAAVAFVTRRRRSAEG